MVSLARLSSRLQPTLLTLRLRRALIHLNPAQTVSANSSRTLAGTAALNAEPAAAPPRLRQCCGRGALHEGTPVGKVEMVGDIETCERSHSPGVGGTEVLKLSVVSSGGRCQPSSRRVRPDDGGHLPYRVRSWLFLTLRFSDHSSAALCPCSVFGISGNLPNNLLLADSFAARGLPVFMPDILNGDAVPATAMNDPDLDLDGWFARHGPDTTRPALDKVIAALRAQGVTRITAVAYCRFCSPSSFRTLPPRSVHGY